MHDSPLLSRATPRTRAAPVPSVWPQSRSAEAPNHLRLVYETALNFLDHHVRGEEFRRPGLL